MSEDQNQATQAPQSAEDRLAAALALFVEADTKAEHERYENEIELLDAQRAAIDAKAAAEDARHVAAIASLRERAAARLLAAVESIPAAVPAAPSRREPGC